VIQHAAAPEYHRNGGDYHAPTTLVEQILAGIWAGVLGVDRIGVDESFFHLGGDSLSAMRAVAAINTALDTNLAVTTIFDAPSVRSLSEQLGRHSSSANELPTVSPGSEL
jgi:acyl carrier protein